MKKGYDCKSITLTEDFSTSLYIMMAFIPKYQDDSNYTQLHDFVITLCDESVNMNITKIAIFTSNSSDTISAFYVDRAPRLKVIINEESGGWGIYVKPAGLYSRPIGLKVECAGNPAAIYTFSGEKPRFDASSLTSQIAIGFLGDYCKINSNMLSTEEEVTSFITDTSNKGFNYSIQYNAYSYDKSITPLSNVSAVWFVEYEQGFGGVNNYAIQKWTAVVGSTVYRYIRLKTDTASWGSFIEI